METKSFPREGTRKPEFEILKKIAFCALALSTFGATFAGATQSAEAAWTGKASYYTLKSRTANGGRVGHMTCAHRTLPFGTKLRVTNLANHRTAVVTVNDRGPFIKSRIIDVSGGAATALGFRNAGVARVKVELAGR
jgi:rare lipoprotein A